VAIGPSSNQVVLPLVLAWVAAVPPAGVAETPGKRLARLALPLMAVLETLQGYPVAGTQVGASSVLFIPAGALCIADGIAALRRHAAGRGAEWIRRTTVILGALTVALAVKFAYGSVLRSAIDTGVAYSDRTGLPFAGASRVRLQEPDALALTNVVQLLQSNHCTALIGYPSINSLYLWAFIDQPTQTVPGAWMRLLDDRRQQRVVDELERSPRPCAVRNNDMVQFWLSGQAPPDRPLVRYVMTRFTPVAPPQGPYEVLVAKPRPR
jgi:hypothetical protein